MSAALIRARSAALLAVGLAMAPLPVSARITKSRPSASSPAPLTDKVSSLLAPFYSTVIGSGIEYQTDDEQTEYGFPMLIEYNATERFKITIEPKFLSIVGKKPDVRSVRGMGDLETTLDYEFLRERRYRPALSLEGKIKWPTAADPDLGHPGRDYSLGLLASKDLIFVNLDLNLLYTFSGHQAREDEVEMSFAIGWRLNHYVELITEVANTTRVGTFRDPGHGKRNETEAVVGLAWQVTHHLKLEQGIVFKEHGVWEAVFAWEWSFGGDN